MLNYDSYFGKSIHCLSLFALPHVSLSDAVSSHNTSEAQEVDDSISEVIDVLRGTVLSDGKSTELPKEYEDTDRSVHQGVSVIMILGRFLFTK